MRIVIEGGPITGKSTLLLELAHFLESKGASVSIPKELKGVKIDPAQVDYSRFEILMLEQDR